MPQVVVELEQVVQVVELLLVLLLELLVVRLMLELEQLLAESDIVSIHAPLNEKTNGLVGQKELGMMKKDAILVNMGRGGIVDESALAQAIDDETIAGAAFDVFVKEPIPSDNPLLKVRHQKRLRLSPHTAWASVQARERLVSQIAENIAKGW